MVSAPPGWCENCGAELAHCVQPGGRVRRFCGDACRQQFNRQLRLRRELAREIGLSPAQLTRLLSLYRVTPRR
jgi:AraC-like DNA-binding protein